MSEQPKMKMDPSATLQDYIKMQEKHGIGPHIEPQHRGINSFGAVVNTKPADLHANLGTEPEVIDNDAAILRKTLAENKKLKEDNENLRLQIADESMKFHPKLEPVGKIKLTPEVVGHLNKIKESYVAPQESNVIDPGEYKPEVKEEAKPKPTFAKKIITEASDDSAPTN